MSEREHETIETDNADSNPNASGPDRLAGDMGISSERVQGGHDQPDRSAPDTDDDSVEGLGSKASTVGTTDGQMPVDPTGHDGDPSAVAGQEEENPDGVANKHPFDPSRNPGHSHG